MCNSEEHSSEITQNKPDLNCPVARDENKASQYGL